MFDMMDMAKEINDAMGRSYDVPEGLDESDLMAELDGLEEDMGAEELGAGGTPSYLQVRGVMGAEELGAGGAPSYLQVRGSWGRRSWGQEERPRTCR